MSRLLKFWKDVSIVKKLYFIVGIMAVLIAIELVILSVAMRTLSAGRAFVGGESLWSKAQKNALYDLQNFAVRKDEEDYQSFLRHLDIPKGDRAARIELSKPNPDLNAVREGFRRGRIHEDDINLLIELLQRFYWVSYIEDAVHVWSEGDNLLTALEEAGFTYYQAVKNNNATEARSALNEITRLNQEITRLEEDFSQILGEGCRWLEKVVLSILFLIVLTVEGVSLTMAFAISRQLSRGLKSLEITAGHYGRGNFSHFAPVEGNDEIGKLGIAVNAMGLKLKEEYNDLENRVKTRTAELTQMAAENAKLFQKAQMAIESRDEFLSIASHELKTPLTALHLQLQMFPRMVEKLTQTEDTQRLGHMAQESLEQVRRVTALLNDLLDLTRIRIGKFEIFREKCDLREIVQDAVKQLHIQASRAGTIVTVSGEAEAPGNFDAVRMTEVFTNLLSNAIKYGNGQPVHIDVQKIENNVRVSVRDGGKGIAKDVQPRLFERFERGKADRKISGLGLGLYISHQIVKAHGGSITVESTLGEGSTFTVSI